jgi:glycosyltransferase involved in cell wall biosynthesis
MKRILLTTSPGAYLYHGGGEREIFLLRDALNKVGLIADLYGPDSRPVSEYDTVIHFSLAGDTEQLLEQLAGDDRQMILWPNLWFVEEPSKDTVAHLQKLVNRFCVIVFKSNAECVHFRKYFAIQDKKIIFVLPGVSNEFTTAKRTTLFTDVYGVKDYIFWPGIIEPQKNQLKAIRALSDLDIPLVVSGSVRDQAYFRLCRESAGANILFVPEMPFGSEIYISALTGCKVFLELPLDFPGVSAMEAFQANCELILSDCDWSKEFFDAKATLVDAGSEENIRQAVLLQLERKFVVASREKSNEFLLPRAFSNLYDYLLFEARA